MAGWCNTAPKATASSTLLTETDAVRIYEEATRLDAIPGSYPPDDTGSSGLAVCKAAKREGRITAYRHAFSIHGALLALQAGPVITGVPWYEGFDSPDADGHVAIAGQVRGGHEFEIVGFTPVGAHYLDGLVEAVNSWGAGWGKTGHFFFTARTWSELLAQSGDCTVPIA